MREAAGLLGRLHLHALPTSRSLQGSSFQKIVTRFVESHYDYVVKAEQARSKSAQDAYQRKVQELEARLKQLREEIAALKDAAAACQCKSDQGADNNTDQADDNKEADLDVQDEEADAEQQHGIADTDKAKGEANVKQDETDRHSADAQDIQAEPSEEAQVDGAQSKTDETNTTKVNVEVNNAHLAIVEAIAIASDAQLAVLKKLTQHVEDVNRKLLAVLNRVR